MSIIGRRLQGLRILQGVLCAFLAVVLYWVVFQLYFGLTSSEPLSVQSVYLFPCLISAIAIFADNLRYPSSRNGLIQVAVMSQMRPTLRQLIMVTLFLSAYVFAVRDLALSRGFVASYLVALFPTLLFLNARMPALLAPLVFRGRYRCGVVVWGEGAGLERVKEWISSKSIFGFEYLGWVNPSPSGADEEDSGCLGSASDLDALLQRGGVAMLIVDGLPSDNARLNELKEVCDASAVRLVFACHLSNTIEASLSFYEDAGIHLMSVRSEPLECPANRMIKRALDVLVALPVVFFLLPVLCVVVTVIHRLQSPGKLFFLQTRTGLNNHRFSILKFRTMCENHGEDERQATMGDERIFPAGAFLRKFSIDEMPQFLNVLLGDMSVVGPRPHLLSHDEQCRSVKSDYRLRSLVKPGITGLAQVRGFRGEFRADKDIVDRASSDIFYLENWTPVMDIWIILQTAVQIIRAPKTAY